jgi:type IV pilus assembly protein PilW
MLSTSRSPATQRGLSLVELMVGIAVGLIVVAASTLLVTSQLSDNRRLLLETQVQQDLRATADIIVRELRRAGSSATSQSYVANATLPPGFAASAGEPQRNPYLDLTVTAGPPPQVVFNYKRADNTVGPFGYRLVNGVIETDISTGQATDWQDLTDSNVLVVDQFAITQDPWTPVKLPCAKPCPVVGGQPADYCYPSIGVRTFTVRIVAHSRADASITRTIESKARLRNDNVVFPAPLPTASPTDPLPPACPA